MPTQIANADLVFIHLSDIHFRHGRLGDPHDEDSMVRNEIELDLRRLRSRLPRFDGLIISGDIAFGGKPEEYVYAGSWIESIREQLGCGHEGVMMISGNHDVDQSSIPDGGAVDQIHAEVRASETLEQCDASLAGVLRDNGRGATLLGPLTAYNAFAQAYGCQFTPNCPYWERDFQLSDGTTLRFRGITTTLLSGPRDDALTHKMLYGGAQRTVLRAPNVRYAIIGHHPPSWSIEGDSADHAFSTLSFLQVFGHKHEQWVTRIGDSVRVIAGAVHPSRLESNWLPRYEAIAISAKDERRLALRIYPRRWSIEELKFMADYNSEGKDFRDYVVSVEPRQL
jgi:hypothetical protein